MRMYAIRAPTTYCPTSRVTTPATASRSTIPATVPPETNTNPVFRFTTSQTWSSAMVAGNRAPYRLLRFTLPSISGIPSTRNSSASPRLVRRISISVHLLAGAPGPDMVHAHHVHLTLYILLYTSLAVSYTHLRAHETRHDLV